MRHATKALGLMNLSISAADQKGSPLPELVVLDACVLLNLFASQHAEEILASLPFRCLVASHVRREALWYLSPAEDDNERLERREIMFDPLIAAGRIEVVDLTSEEEATLVELAQNLDDGEAASGALAVGRAAFVATDDFKAIQFFRRLTPPLRTIETGALLRYWAERSGATRGDVARTLHSIRRGARFSPRMESDTASWWHELLREIPSGTCDADDALKQPR